MGMELEQWGLVKKELHKHKGLNKVIYFGWRIYDDEKVG